MMLPLVPYSQQYNTDAFMRNEYGSRQRKPYNVDTPYYLEVGRVIWGEASAQSWSGLDRFDSMKVSVTNQSRERFVNKLGDSSSFGATITAERRETYNMVVGGIVRLAKAARHVKRLELQKAAALLGVPVKERTRQIRVGKTNRRIPVQEMQLPNSKHWRKKTAASAWLYYSYGIRPLAQDIQNGMDVLTRPCPDARFRSFAKDYAEQYIPNGPYAPDYYRGEYSVQITAYVRVSNPNLWLANQLGLVNPLQWANEAIPFSFVLDWVSNLSQVISQMTDFVGLEISRPLTTTKYVHIDGNRLGYKTITIFQRSLSIPEAKLQFAYERFSWQRGLNAISLLVGFLPKR